MSMSYRFLSTRISTVFFQCLTIWTDELSTKCTQCAKRTESQCFKKWKTKWLPMVNRNLSLSALTFVSSTKFENIFLMYPAITHNPLSFALSCRRPLLWTDFGSTIYDFLTPKSKIKFICRCVRLFTLLRVVRFLEEFLLLLLNSYNFYSSVLSAFLKSYEFTEFEQSSAAGCRQMHHFQCIPCCSCSSHPSPSYRIQ